MIETDPEIFANEGDYLVCRYCQKPAHIMARTVRDSDGVHSSDILNIDGSPLEYGARMQCPLCSAPNTPFGVDSEKVEELRQRMAFHGFAYTLSNNGPGAIFFPVSPEDWEKIQENKSNRCLSK